MRRAGCPAMTWRRRRRRFGARKPPPLPSTLILRPTVPALASRSRSSSTKSKHGAGAAYAKRATTAWRRCSHPALRHGWAMSTIRMPRREEVMKVYRNAATGETLQVDETNKEQVAALEQAGFE